MVLQPVGNQAPGTSWLELYLLYRMGGAPQPIMRQANEATVRPTLVKQIVSFKKLFRALTLRIVSDTERKLFAPSLAKMPRFKPLGITGHAPMISAAVSITDQAADKLHALLIKLLHRVSRKRMSAVVDGSDRPVKRKLVLQKAIQFDRSIPKYHHHIWNTVGAKALLVPGTSSHPPPSNGQGSAQAPYFACPACAHLVHVRHKAFHTGNYDATIRCNGCNKAYPARTFQCQCNRQWLFCEDHQLFPVCLRDINPGLKRQLENEPSQNAKIARLSVPESTLSPEAPSAAMREINPRFLSCGLKRKFAHLLPSDG